MNVIVTGASRGIGYDLVKALAGEGHHVIATARSGDKLHKLFHECRTQQNNTKVHVLAHDIADVQFGEVLGDLVNEVFKKIDILVNNAGYLVNKNFENLTAEDFDKIFSVNVKSVFLLIQAMKNKMAKGSHIINVGSMGGFQGSLKFPGLSLYSASKGALATLTECLAVELESDEISINCLALGSAQTEMLNEAFPEYKAPVSSSEMAAFIKDFALNGHKVFNGKILPVSLSTP